VMTVGAIASMVGVLLNLLLGMSRVLLAMARRRDLPEGLAQLRGDRSAPKYAPWVASGLTLLMLLLLQDIKLTWGFSAFSVLLYYSIMHAAALRLSDSERFYSPWIARIGLLLCASLAFWVDWRIWLVGLGVIVFLCLVKWAQPWAKGMRS
jgi:basic amino acid/polyamine antiporter, APA family